MDEIIVKIVPLADQKQPLFGKMKGTGQSKGNLFSTGEEWNVGT